nr:PREDICTED: RRP12-like protein [Latimeria chalumnae]|eukprot:XP_006014388.2 PREDICTED: RRP12-like protein [Latimeria chalumnae]
MQALHSLFAGSSSSSSLTAELNAQIITALYDYLPNENDLQPVLAWLAVMEKAHVSLSRIQSGLCVGHLPRVFSTTMNCFLSPHSQVISMAAQTLKTLLKECVGPNMAEIGPIKSTDAPGPASYVCKMFR